MSILKIKQQLPLFILKNKYVFKDLFFDLRDETHTHTYPLPWLKKWSSFTNSNISPDNTIYRKWQVGKIKQTETQPQVIGQKRRFALTLVESSSRLVWSAINLTPSIALCISGQWCHEWVPLQTLSWCWDAVPSPLPRSCPRALNPGGGVPWMRHALRVAGSSSLQRPRDSRYCFGMSLTLMDRKSPSDEVWSRLS